MHLSVFLGTKEVMWLMAEWCVTSRKQNKKEKTIGAGEGESERSTVNGEECAVFFLVVVD